MMTTITRQECLGLIMAHGTKFFTIIFTKKDGSRRVMTARRGVHKGVTGKGMAYSPSEKSLLPVFESGKGFRMVNVQTIEELRMCGEVYAVV